MRDTILALGCSFTDEKFRAANVPDDFPEHLKGGWKVWPEVFRDRLSERDGVEYKVMNIGKSGSGMDWHANEFFQHWTDYKNDIKIVLWGGSSWYRFYHMTTKERFAATDLSDPKFYNSPEEAINKRIDRMKKCGMYEYTKSVAFSLNSHKAREEIAKKYMSMVVGIKDLCESTGVDFMLYQLLEPMTAPSFNHIGASKDSINRAVQLNLFRECKNAWEQLCNSKHIIGWNRSDFVEAWATKYKNRPYLIEDNIDFPNNDSHPNEAGQVHIAEIFWNNYTS